MIIVQDLETVTFCVLFIYKPTLSVIPKTGSANQFKQWLSLFLDNRLFNLNGIWRIRVWPWPWPDRPDPLLWPWTSLWYNSESSKLAGSELSGFMFVYIHFNVPTTRIADLVRNVSVEKIYWYGTVTFVCVFAFINLVCVSYTANEYSFYHLYYNKRLPFLFQEWLLSKIFKL